MLPNIVNREEFGEKRHFYIKKLKESVFIYPTDTIYGIGCDATNKKLVSRIRAVKKSKKQPFSVIAPSKAWIEENCVISDVTKKWLKKLPGPYTLIIKLKNKKCVAENVNQGLMTIGIRIPDNWMAKVVEEMGIPVITTSANITGGNFMTRLEDLGSIIRNKVDMIVYDGELRGTPSTLVIIDKEEVEIHKRKSLSSR
jgi:tRNA threonylcarbamoyl adenosine modification protein (Sua5/YciO/YrdC/YwlC family)